jgi:cation transport protein ChaC
MIAGLIRRWQPAIIAPMTITRETLIDGSFHAMLARADPTQRLLTDAERCASIEALFGPRLGREDCWVFGYGSLIWNPTFRFVERRVARLRGWHRRFCLWTSLGRGTPDCPGLMLALDRGGSCHGVAFRIAAAEAPFELDLLWRREMVSGSYCPRLVRVTTADGPLEAVAFTINRRHPRYAGKLSEEEAAGIIAAARGLLGPCAEYLVNTVDHLNALGLRDPCLERLRSRVAPTAAAPPRPGCGDTPGRSESDGSRG